MKLQELKELADNATPGPYELGTGYHGTGLRAERDQLKAEAKERNKWIRQASLLNQVSEEQNQLREKLEIAELALEEIAEDKFINGYWDRAREALAKLRGEKC